MLKNPTSTLCYYLLNGNVCAWDGESTPVYSPVLAENGERVCLGASPLMTPDAAMDAVEAASSAWDNGRGAWPSAHASVRINAMRVFVDEMRKWRSDVVRFLSWEIGKTVPDSEKECDRTVEYIEATILEYERLDAGSQHIDAAGGVLAKTKRAPLGVCLCMGPFNYPLNETYTTVSPILIKVDHGGFSAQAT